MNKSLLDYREFQWGMPDAPSILSLASDKGYDGRDIIIAYLKRGRLYNIRPAGFDDAPVKVDLTDGEYVWCDELAYYIKEYNVRLPRDIEVWMLRHYQNSD